MSELLWWGENHSLAHYDVSNKTSNRNVACRLPFQTICRVTGFVSLRVFPSDYIYNGINFEETDHTKLLGLELDDELIFECHIDTICKKISKRIGILKNIRNYAKWTNSIL